MSVDALMKSLDQFRQGAKSSISGTIDPADIHEFERTIPASIIDRFRKFDDLTGPVADALDELGVRGAVPASVLPPTIPGSQIVGSALTLRRVPSRFDPHVVVSSKTSRMAAMDVHFQAKPGDVLVIEDPGGGSSGGGDSSMIGMYNGEIGAVVDGCIRDVGQSRRIGYPIWARTVTPMTGKWRTHAVEIGGIVTIAGVQVAPGDLVIADDDGICFVPADLAEKVLIWVEDHFHPTEVRGILDQLREHAESEALKRSQNGR